MTQQEKFEIEGEELVPLTIRFSRADVELLRDLAHAARLPLARYVRALALNKVPPQAPPVPNEQSPAAMRLVQICRGAGSNLTQLQRHAGESTDQNLARLAQSDALQKLQDRVLEIGLSVKSGNNSETHTHQILQVFESPAANLNELAKALNEGRVVALTTWGEVLKSVQAAIE